MAFKILPKGITGYHLTLCVCTYLAVYYIQKSIFHFINGHTDIPEWKIIQSDEFLTDKATIVFTMILNWGFIWTSLITLFGVFISMRNEPEYLMMNGTMFLPHSVLVLIYMCFGTYNEILSTDEYAMIHGTVSLCAQMALFFKAPIIRIPGTRVMETDNLIRRKVFGFTDIERVMLSIIPPDMRNFITNRPMDNATDYVAPGPVTAEDYTAPFLHKFFYMKHTADGQVDDDGQKKIRMLNEIKRVLLEDYLDESGNWIAEFPLHLVDGGFFYRRHGTDPDSVPKSPVVDLPPPVAL